MASVSENRTRMGTDVRRLIRLAPVQPSAEEPDAVVGRLAGGREGRVVGDARAGDASLGGLDGDPVAGGAAELAGDAAAARVEHPDPGREHRLSGERALAE